MITTTSVTELLKIVNVEHSDPHHVLGMHEINEGENGVIISLREFIPQAKSIFVIDAEDETKKYEMIKIHEDGFFEVIIPDRDKWFKYYISVTDFDHYSFFPFPSRLRVSSMTRNPIATTAAALAKEWNSSIP